MKIFLTLDYELFLGEKTGTVENCLVTPLREMVNEIGDTGAKFTVFVDATYLLRMSQLKKVYSTLSEEYKKLKSHIRSLETSGHDVQLHIHPHWAYSEFNGEQWMLDSDHYKLCDLPLEEAQKIFRDAKNLLDDIVEKETTCFRAGGFSTQPTEILTILFSENGIKIDASVCPGTDYHSQQQEYDYLNCPKKDMWRFDKGGICSEDINGRFTEFPITMQRISPLFYWKLAALRFMRLAAHKRWGDGISVKTTNESIRQRLMGYTNGMATIDGYKIANLLDCYEQCKKRDQEYMVILGHPKLATPYSVKHLGEFCKEVKKQGDVFATFSELA